MDPGVLGCDLLDEVAIGHRVLDVSGEVVHPGGASGLWVNLITIFTPLTYGCSKICSGSVLCCLYELDYFDTLVSYAYKIRPSQVGSCWVGPGHVCKVGSGQVWLGWVRVGFG